jgi:hypothetical protein
MPGPGPGNKLAHNLIALDINKCFYYLGEITREVNDEEM